MGIYVEHYWGAHLLPVYYKLHQYQKLQRLQIKINQINLINRYKKQFFTIYFINDRYSL